jgi:hypothetical protein
MRGLPTINQGGCTLDVVTIVTTLRSFWFFRKLCALMVFPFPVLFSSCQEKRNYDWKKTSLGDVGVNKLQYLPE